MNDCPDADVRDLLPDLLHDRLDEATRAMVESHLEGCADCRAELALLRDVRDSLRQARALNIAAITAAVPSYRAPVRRSWVGWRTAAAAAIVVMAASSLLVMQRGVSTKIASSPGVAAPKVHTPELTAVVPESQTVAVVPPSVEKPLVHVPSRPQPAETPVEQAPTSGARELAMAGGSLTDLSDRELTSLLKEIESLDALPSTDVESVPIAPIAPRRSTP
jgi:anti-sigma factor RsiW